MAIRIEIYLDGERLELSEGQTVELEINSPAFSEQVVSGAFSWPIEVPMTAGNRCILDFADLPESRVDFARPRPGRFVSDAFETVCSISILSVKKESFQLQIRLGSSIAAERLASSTLRQIGWPQNINLLAGSYYQGGPMPPDFASPQDLAAYLAAFEHVVLGFANEQALPDQTGYVCAPILAAYDFESMGPIYNWGGLSAGAAPRVHVQMQAAAIIRKLFAWLEVSLEGRLLEDQALRRVVCYNRNTWPVLQTQFGYCPVHQVDWSTFVPPITAGDWFKAFCRYFFIAPFWSLDGRRCTLVRLKSLLASGARLDWTQKVVPRLSALEQTELEGYRIGYAVEPSDELAGTYLVDEWQEFAHGPFAPTLQDLPAQAQIDEVRYVASEDFYYRYDEQQQAWEPFAMPLAPYNLAGDKAYETGAATIWGRHDPASGLMLPRVKQKAQKVEVPRFLNWLGRVRLSNDPSPQLAAPQISHRNLDGQGVEVPFCDSLVLTDAGSVVERHGRPWLDMLEGSGKRLTVQVMLSAAELAALTLQEQVRISGSRYLIVQVKARLPVTGPSEVVLQKIG